MLNIHWPEPGRGIPKEGTSISPYWRRNHTDEAWREVKAAFVVEMRDDA